MSEAPAALPRYARPAALVGLALCALAFLALAALQYRMPEGFNNAWGANPRSVAQFDRALGFHPAPAASIDGYAALFRGLLLAAWAGYGLLLAALLRGAAIPPRWLLGGAGILCGVLAVLCPASLSTDVYAYVAHARVAVDYGLNPYTHSVAELLGRDREIEAYLRWDNPTVYGPVWTLLSMGLVFALQGAGLWGQVVGLKLLAGGALIIASAAAGLCADALRAGTSRPGDGSGQSQPVRSPLVHRAFPRCCLPATRGEPRDYEPAGTCRMNCLPVAAVAFNPLFLIEGPWNGHNDTLMVALLLAGLALYFRGQTNPSWLVLGASVGTKFVTAPIVPWLVLARCWGRPLRRAAVLVGTAAALTLAPLVLGYAPFWEGTGTLASLRGRGAEEGIGSTPPGAPGSTAPVPGAARPPGTGARLLKPGILVLACLLLTAWFWRGRQPERVLAAWTVLALLLALLPWRVQYPWYFLWPCATAFAGTDRLHRWLWVPCLILGVQLTLLYTIPYQP